MIISQEFKVRRSKERGGGSELLYHSQNNDNRFAQKERSVSMMDKLEDYKDPASPGVNLSREIAKAQYSKETVSLNRLSPQNSRKHHRN